MGGASRAATTQWATALRRWCVADPPAPARPPRRLPTLLPRTRTHCCRSANRWQPPPGGTPWSRRRQAPAGGGTAQQGGTHSDKKQIRKSYRFADKKARKRDVEPVRFMTTRVPARGRVQAGVSCQPRRALLNSRPRRRCCRRRRRRHSSSCCSTAHLLPTFCTVSMRSTSNSHSSSSRLQQNERGRVKTSACRTHTGARRGCGAWKGETSASINQPIHQSITINQTHVSAS